VFLRQFVVSRDKRDYYKEALRAALCNLQFSVIGQKQKKTGANEGELPYG
jgi:hypothetical protein